MLLKKVHFNRYRQQSQCFHIATLCNGNLLFSVAILMCLIANGISKTDAVPTNSLNGAARAQLLQRAVRDVTAIASSLIRDESKDPTATTAAVPAAVVAAASPLSAASLVSAASSNIDEATATSSSSAVQPKGLCLLNGILVAELTVLCEKQSGCRAIQRTGHCCPDYKCDCEKDGKTYTNGDKLVDPENPCTVCYCQGGEILCSSVTCFHRDDCTPKYIPGRCCPEYDNCPVSSPEPQNTTTSNKTLNNEFKDEPQGALNPKITIKEITKPIEIRITDENKAISIHQMLKPSTTEATTTTTTAAKRQKTLTTATVTSKPTATTTANNSTTSLATSRVGNTASKLQQSNENISKVSIAEEHFSEATNLQNTKPNIHHVNSSDRKTPLLLSHNNESLKLSASVAYSSSSSSSASAPSVPIINGVANAQEMREMVAGGNYQQGSEKVSFSDFGTQGLQRVDAAEGSEVNNNKVNIKREFLDTTTAPATEDFTTADVVYTYIDNSGGNSTNLQHSSAEAAADPETAESDNIYHIIMTTVGPRRSTENFLPNKATDLPTTGGLQTSFKSNSATGGSSDQSQGSEVISSAELSPNISGAPPSSTITTSNSSQTLNISSIDHDSTSWTAALLTPTTETNHASSTEGGTHHHQHHAAPDDEDGAIPVESNPAYPSLPEDDFSLRDVNFPLSEGEELVDEPRSIGGSGGGVGGATAGATGPYDTFKRIAHIDDVYLNMSGSGSGDSDAVVPPLESSTESRAPLPNISLMYSTEDASEETASIANASNFQPSSSVAIRGIVGNERVKGSLKESETESGSGESLEIDSMELLISGGSGASSAADLTTSNAKKSTSKQREQTTPRPTKQPETLDIDELGSADEGPKSPAEDPKLEVESLKVNDNEEDGVAQQETASKVGNLLSVKTKEGSERAFLETQVLEGREVAVGVADRVQRLFLQRVY